MARIDFVTGNAQVYLPDVEALAAVPDRVEGLIAGRSSGDLRRAGEDGRSAARAIGDMVARARHDRYALHRMAWMSDPQLPALDLDAENEREFWESHLAPELLEWLTEALAETVDLLKEQPDAAWGRAGAFEDGRHSIRQRVRDSASFYDARLEEATTHLGG
jgi:hypothetical protein